MRKLKMSKTNTITFEEGCNKYLENCRQRNLREGTINHYRQSYTQFHKYFAPEIPITDMTEEAYKNYVVYLRETLHNDVKDDIPAAFLRHYPSLKSGKLNVSEIARVCNLSRTTVYKYVSLLEN